MSPYQLLLLQGVKARLEKERDLDGIESANIVQGGRRSRTATTKGVAYKCDVIPMHPHIFAALFLVSTISCANSPRG